jgi:hypothetical protein
MNLTNLGWILILVTIIAGCSGSLALKDAIVVPAKVAPGDAATVQVKVEDPDGVVTDVTATVREYPQMVLDLKDDGKGVDEVADDGIWSVNIDVPFETQKGTYNWDFKAYDVNGKVLKITHDDGKEVTLKAEAAVVVTD